MKDRTRRALIFGALVLCCSAALEIFLIGTGDILIGASLKIPENDGPIIAPVWSLIVGPTLAGAITSLCVLAAKYFY